MSSVMTNTRLNILIETLELFITAELINYVKVPDFHSLGTHKDTAVGGALKVSSALNSAIVFTSRFVQSDAYPSTDARNFGNDSNKLDSSTTFDRCLTWTYT
jgi:hypothetical protein